MEEVILFMMCYGIVLLFYELFIVRKAKKYYDGKMNKKQKEKYKDPVEILYLTNIYKLNMKKVNYKQLLQIIALTSSFDISLVVSVMSILSQINFLLCLVVGFLLVFILIFVSYYLVYLFYKKKGMVKNG